MDVIQDAGLRIVKKGNRTFVNCPWHDGDNNPSCELYQAQNKGYCHACKKRFDSIDLWALHNSCTNEEAIKRLAEQFDIKKQREKIQKQFICAYDYHDEAGKLVYQVCRYLEGGKKTFKARRPDGKGWLYNLEGVEPLPYRLPELVKAIERGETVYVLEGEKDCDNLAKISLTATTNSFGAGKWSVRHSKYFHANADIVILPDNDLPGRDHAQTVAKQLHERGCKVRVVELPGLSAKGDVSDWLADGNTKNELIKVVDGAKYWESDVSKTEITSESKTFPRTESGNAELLAAKYGDKIRFCHSYKQWLLWDGTRWKPDITGQIIKLAKETVRKAYKEHSGNEDAQKFYRSSESKAKLMAMIFLAESLLPVETGALDADPWLLNVQNGILDLRTGNLLQHDPKKFMTKICRAEYKAMKPGLWSQTIEKILPDPAVRQFIQRFAGYSLTGSVREEKFLVLNGEGGTGKGSTTETLAEALGDYADTLAVEILLQSKNTSSGNEPSPELAKLPGVRLLLASETGQGRLLDEARTKSITGGDRVTARRLRCDPFSFVPSFKLWLSTNHIPRVRGQDEGIWRRLRLVPFDHQFKDGEGRDSTLKEKLHCQEVLNEVLIWAVAGCLQWQQHGLCESAAVIASTNQFREACDILEQFIDDECETGPSYEVSVKTLYSIFKNWTRDNGHIPGSSATFTRMMETKKYVKIHKNYGWVWLGIRLIKE